MRTLFRSSLLFVFAAAAAGAQKDSAFAWSRQIPAGARLTIRNMNGPIEVRASSSDRAQVHATVRAGSRGNVDDVTFDVQEHSADDIEICTVYRRESDCEPDHSWNNIRVTVSYVIDLPKGTRFRGFTGNGDVTITQTVGDVEVTSGNGDLSIRESEGRVNGSTGNGDITIESAHGEVKASSGNGRIVANTSRGPVEANTGNGDVDVKMATLGDDAGPMTFTTGSGSVRVTLPADFNGELDASTGNGSIESDFELKVQGRLSSSRLRGTVGNGKGPLIRLRSGNGNLGLRKS